MKTHVEFTSDAFPTYPEEDEEINPGIWGKRLAEYLTSKLPEYGITPKEPYTEDWGWEIPLENERFSMFIGCSNQLEPGGIHFLCFIEPSTPEIKAGLFKKIDTTDDISRVAEALDNILRSHQDIKEIRWWDDSDKK